MQSCLDSVAALVFTHALPGQLALRPRLLHHQPGRGERQAAGLSEPNVVNLQHQQVAGQQDRCTV